MMATLRMLLLAMGLATMAAGQENARPAPWQPAQWEGAKAWTSTSGPWTAVVSEGLGRLVFFGETARGKNLLHVAPSGGGRGGHRVWLGPQTQWKAHWPPPPDWESKGAAGEIEGDTLTLRLPHQDPAYPEVRRSYVWKDGRLECGMAWGGGEPGPFQGIQIFQVRAEAIVRATPVPRAGLPQGLGLVAGRNGEQIDGKMEPWPRQIRHQDDGSVRVERDGAELKIALPPQNLEARIGDVLLRFTRGPAAGAPVREPDQGLLSQLYLGADRYQCPFVEVEQLSPVLSAPAGQSCHFTVFLEARRLAPGETAAGAYCTKVSFLRCNCLHDRQTPR